MINLSKDFAETVLRHPEAFNIFGYFCEKGGGGSDKEFIIWEENNEYFLVHNSEIECDGFLVRLKSRN
jgi:hypothetical protein